MTQIQLPVEMRFLRIPTRWEVGSEFLMPTGLKLDSKPGDVKLEPAPMLIPTIVEEPASYIDGWQLRDRFLKLPQTQDAALSFLHDLGLWSTTEGIDNELPDSIRNAPRPALASWSLSKRPLAHVRGVFEGRYLSETAMPTWASVLWNIQDAFRKYLVRPQYWENVLSMFSTPPLRSQEQATWNAFCKRRTELPLRVEWQDGRPIGVIEVISGEQLLIATTQIDLIRGAKFKLCERPDCRTPFPILSGHDKKYCEWYCGHIESVRRRREEMRNQRKGSRYDKKKRPR